MTNTKQWVALLNQQYTSVLDNKTELGLLLAIRRFVRFLDTNPQSQRYIKEIEHSWEISYERWLSNCQEIRKELFDLESRIRAMGAQIQEFIDSGLEIPDPIEFGRSKHILEKIREDNWYEPWANLTDHIDLGLLPVRSFSHIQTLSMIGHVATVTGVLQNLANTLKVERQSVKELNRQAKMLYRKFEAVEQKVENDWLSSGKYALEQLKTVVRIMDRDIFIDSDNVKPMKIEVFKPWLNLMMMYATSESKEEVQWQLKHSDSTTKVFNDIETPVKSYLNQVFTELQFLATSRLAHQHLVERYKVRCENYEWKSITNMIQGHTELVNQAREETGKKKSYQYEDLLTLHFASYLYDNGYAVHYTLRDGVHEPDLLGNLSNELEPIVVEAKVVNEDQGRGWVREGFQALWAYLEKYHSDYGVTDGYLVIFRIGDEKVPMYKFDESEWVIGQFTIVPRVINLGPINKKKRPIIIKKEDFLPNP